MSLFVIRARFTIKARYRLTWRFNLSPNNIVVGKTKFCNSIGGEYICQWFRLCLCTHFEGGNYFQISIPSWQNWHIHQWKPYQGNGMWCLGVAVLRRHEGSPGCVLCFLIACTRCSIYKHLFTLITHELFKMNAIRHDLLIDWLVLLFILRSLIRCTKGTNGVD